MTDMDDLIARLRHGEGQDWDCPYATRADAADALQSLAAENARLKNALGDICKDSNPDWTEKRDYPSDVLDDIHELAVAAYYHKDAKQ